MDADYAKNLLLPPCFLIQALIALFVISFVAPFFFEIAKDHSLNDYVRSKINGALLNDHFLAVKQNLNAAFFLFVVGCLFFVDFVVDNINFLPDFSICALFIAGIFMINKTNPELKNKKLNVYLLSNLFVSSLAYISGTAYRIKAAAAFVGEDVAYLRALRFLSAASFEISVVLFFLIFIEFYAFVVALQKKHIEFAVRYLDKYITEAEKNFDRGKEKILRICSATFCAKALSLVLPQSGIVLFFHSMILVAFAFFMAKCLSSVKNAIYSYYATKKHES
jgi:hypothetical protein